jgi:hypothetical protein
MRVERRRASRGQGLLALATVLVVAGSFALLARAGPRPPRPATPPGGATTGAWVCPHGGGSGWSATLTLANPGERSATARLTELGERGPEPPRTVEVPAGATVRLPVAADERSSATYVEYFGTWIGAGWVVTAGPAGDGVAAEPCADEPGRRWIVPDGSTEQREDAYLILTNPFDAPAVVDVAIHSPDHAPVRDSAWTDLVVRPRRSIALRLNSKLEGEPVASADVEVSVGRIVAASLGITDGDTIRGSLGVPAPSAGGILPLIGGSGQAELIVTSLSDGSIRLAATELSDEPPRPAGGLTDQEHGPLAARAYAVPVDTGPTAIRAFVLDGGMAATALRALGPGSDLGATAGAATPAASWLVLPATASTGAEPALVVVNDGDEAVVVTLEPLAGEGGTAAPLTLDVPAHGAAAVPQAFLASTLDVAVLVRADAGDVVALAASSTAVDGRRGGAFALALGVPLPAPQARGGGVAS